jgi:acetoin utilization deacetylase AcuC-like enzyme
MIGDHLSPAFHNVKQGSGVVTGFVWDERFAWHDTGSHSLVMPDDAWLEPIPHIENPIAKRRIRNLLEVSGLLERLVAIRAEPATEAELLTCHDPAYVERIRTLSQLGGDAGFRTYVGRGSFEIAALAAGGVIAAVRAVLAGKAENAYALVRPPGHHAEPDRAMGFCLFANAAIAAKWALSEGNLRRVALVDIDAHHGNGTERIFWSDPRALTISVHQDGAFPLDSGGLDAVGDQAGRGTNINIPLPPGSGHGAYIAAFERVVLPALRRFRPELILVPCGFDAGAQDPMSRLMLHSDSYRAVTALLMSVADDVCGGRLVFCHEGGYMPQAVPYLALAVMEQLSGVRTSVRDPFLGMFASNRWQAMQPHQTEVIEAAAALVGAVPKPT